MREISWPTAFVIAVIIGAVVVTLLLGPVAGLDSDTITAALAAEGALGTLVAGFMRQVMASRPVVELAVDPEDPFDDTEVTRRPR